MLSSASSGRSNLEIECEFRFTPKTFSQKAPHGNTRDNRASQTMELDFLFKGTTKPLVFIVSGTGI